MERVMDCFRKNKNDVVTTIKLMYHKYEVL
jgi:hypothetical protein